MNVCKCSFFKHIAKWPKSDVGVKKWITHSRKKGIYVPARMIIFGVRCVDMSGITDFAQKILGVMGLGRGMDYET